MERSGNVYPVKIPDEILQKAVENAVQMYVEAVAEADLEILENGDYGRINAEVEEG